VVASEIGVATVDGRGALACARPEPCDVVEGDLEEAESILAQGDALGGDAERVGHGAKGVVVAPAGGVGEDVRCAEEVHHAEARRDVLVHLVEHERVEDGL
jgi:hypothetical protein